MVFWDLGLCLDGVSCSVAPGSLGERGGWYHWDVDRSLQTFSAGAFAVILGFWLAE